MHKAPAQYLLRVMPETRCRQPASHFLHPTLFPLPSHQSMAVHKILIIFFLKKKRDHATYIVAGLPMAIQSKAYATGNIQRHRKKKRRLSEDIDCCVDDATTATRISLRQQL